jgi:hypothetical protein
MDTLPESKIPAALYTYKGYGNMKKIESLKKQLQRLGIVKSSLGKEEKKKQRACTQSLSLKKMLNNIEYRVSGFVATGGTLKIRCGDWETVYSADRKNHLNLNISGKRRPGGLMKTEESNCVPIPNPLSYPQVQTKNAQALG